MWNRAAERLFGWRKTEVVGRVSPLAQHCAGQDVARPDGTLTSLLAKKDGTPVEVRLVAAPFRDLVGNASTVIYMAEDLTLERRLAEMEGRSAGAGLAAGESPAQQTSGGGFAAPATRVLIVDSDEPWGQELAGILSGLGYSPTRCASMGEAAVVLADAEAAKRSFALAVVDLLASAGSGGLGQSAILRGLGFAAPVVVSSDADVRGHEQHGLAGVIRRPYQAEAVDRAVRDALKQRG
jgi:CheY-like chemotaxis protein